MSPRSVALLGFPVGVLIVSLVSSAASRGLNGILPAAIVISAAVAGWAAWCLRRPSPARVRMPGLERVQLRRRALTYREGGRARGAPWGLLLCGSDPYAVPALEAYAAAAAAAGEGDVAAEVRETMERWKAAAPC